MKKIQKSQKAGKKLILSDKKQKTIKKREKNQNNQKF